MYWSGFKKYSRSEGSELHGYVLCQIHESALFVKLPPTSDGENARLLSQSETLLG